MHFTKSTKFISFLINKLTVKCMVITIVNQILIVLMFVYFETQVTSINESDVCLCYMKQTTNTCYTWPEGDEAFYRHPLSDIICSAHLLLLNRTSYMKEMTINTIRPTTKRVDLPFQVKNVGRTVIFFI